MILKRCYPANASIIKKTIIFPNGKEISIGSQGMSCYFITSKEELEFLSKQRDLQIVDPTQTEVVNYLESLPEVPVVGTAVENPKEFDPAQFEEELLRGELIKRGYDVSKSSGSNETSSVMSKLSDTAIVSEFMKRYKTNPDIAKAASIEFNDYDGNLESMSFEELKQLLAKLGYSGLRKKG